MTDMEQRVWRVLLRNRKASPEEIATKAMAPVKFVKECIARIGTPEEIWRNMMDDTKYKYAQRIQEPPGRVGVLREAEKLTAGDRNKAYGEPVANMQHIADIFNATTGHRLSARDVAILHQCTKMARRYHNPLHRDSYVDDAAYVGIQYECALDEMELVRNMKKGTDE